MTQTLTLSSGRADALVFALRTGAPSQPVAQRCIERHVARRPMSVPLSADEARELDRITKSLLQRPDFRRFLKDPQSRGTLGERVRGELAQLL